MREIFKALTFTCFVFGFAGWAYIAGNAIFHPYTLPMQLTHFAPWPREDTFGAICFVVSSVSLFAYQLLRSDTK